MKENIKKIIKEKYHYFEGVMGYRKINIQLKKENTLARLYGLVDTVQLLHLYFVKYMEFGMFWQIKEEKELQIFRVIGTAHVVI